MIQQKDKIPEGSCEIWLAAGCFWGLEKYASGISGVISASSGYANGSTVSPVYEQVCKGSTGFAEAVHVVYDQEILPLSKLLEIFMEVVVKTSQRELGGKPGGQYRNGIYYKAKSDLPVILRAVKKAGDESGGSLPIEVEPIKNYYLAEEYHQGYLKKNPGGFCHISDKLCSAAWNWERNS